MDATNNLVSRMQFDNAYKVPYLDLVRDAWSDEERERIESAARAIPPAQLRAINIHAEVFVKLEHASLPPGMEITRGLSLLIRQPDSHVRFWPARWGWEGAETHLTNPTLLALAADIAKDALDRYTVKLACDTLRRKCEFHEQALALFPFWANVCRKAGYYDIADLQVDRHPPGMPALTEQERRAVRHANQVVAAHQLIGTLDLTYNQQSRDEENCTVTLHGNHVIEFVTDADVEWSVTLIA